MNETDLPVSPKRDYFAKSSIANKGQASELQKFYEHAMMVT